jgi:predicted NUDIX family NTP pyrophosphohydrolase
VATRRSAGILLYRWDGARLVLLLGHMGGPFWARKEAGAWTIPKGEHGEEEDPWDAACREFAEELGVPVPEGRCLDLGEVRQSGGKVVRAFAVEGEVDLGALTLGTFEMEWPRGSGRMQTFPELDRVDWFGPEEAHGRLVTAQRVLVERLLGALAG